MNPSACAISCIAVDNCSGFCASLRPSAWGQKLICATNGRPIWSI